MSDFITHGVLTLSNHGGLEIQLSDDGESARLRYFGKVCRWQYIKHYPSGTPYVRYNKGYWALNKFMKV